MEGRDHICYPDLKNLQFSFINKSFKNVKCKYKGHIDKNKRGGNRREVGRAGE